MIEELCPPSLIYLAFSLTHVTIDLFKGLYNTALIKFIVMIFFTLLLNILCSSGLTIISWIIVFIPFIMLTVITSILLYIFGLSPTIGNDLKINKYNSIEEYEKNKNKSNNTKTTNTNPVVK
jgi:predicted membrane protein